MIIFNNIIITVNYLSLLLLTSLVNTATSKTYYVIPDDHSVNNYTRNNTFTLQHYLNNISKYFVSHNQLHFLPGQYCTNSDLVFKNIHNFTLNGHDSVIICSSPASIIVTNAANVTLQNIILIDCTSLLKTSTDRFYACVLFAYCSSVTMQNVYVNVSSNVTTHLIAIQVINVVESKIMNAKVQVNILMCHSHPVTIVGLAIDYNHRAKVKSPGVMIEAFSYSSQKSCLKYSQCAIKCIILTDFFDVLIRNTVFVNLSNSSALHYYGSSNTEYNDTLRLISLLIVNVTVMHNTGYGDLKMLHIMFQHDIEASFRVRNPLY